MLWFRGRTNAGAHQLRARCSILNPFFTTQRKWRNRYSPKENQSTISRGRSRRMWAAKRAGVYKCFSKALPVFIWEVSTPGRALPSWHSLLSWPRHPQYSGLPQFPISPHLPFKPRQNPSPMNQSIPSTSGKSPKSDLILLAPVQFPGSSAYLNLLLLLLLTLIQSNCPVPLPFRHFCINLPIQSTGFPFCLLSSSLKINSPLSI